jgi:hypothetical protein
MKYIHISKDIIENTKTLPSGTKVICNKNITFADNSIHLKGSIHTVTPNTTSYYSLFTNMGEYSILD